MIEVADDIWRLGIFGRSFINAYLVSDILIDAATILDRAHILSQLRGRRVAGVALTHVHPDHQGAASAVCEAFHCPLSCHELDAAAMEGREAMGPPGPIMRRFANAVAGPRRRVDRQLRDGDEIGGLRVIHAPGHTPGHVIYFRERDRVALAGDVASMMRPPLTRLRLREPPHIFSHDWRQNRTSIQILASLRPRVVLFGHGVPLRNGEMLAEFAERMRPERIAASSG